MSNSRKIQAENKIRIVYKKGAMSQQEAAAQLSVHRSAVDDWVRKYETEGFRGILKRERYYGRRFTSREELVFVIEKLHRLLQQSQSTTQSGRHDPNGKA